MEQQHENGLAEAQSSVEAMKRKLEEAEGAKITLAECVSVQSVLPECDVCAPCAECDEYVLSVLPVLSVLSVLLRQLQVKLLG